jgi:hypothetical protein
MKMAAFWSIAPCSIVEVDRHLEVCTVSFIRAMISLKRLSTSMRRQGAMSQKAVILISLLLRIREVPCSNLSPETDYPD